tara:strand:- start:798 stop:1301 length:504 start_codon:yes stop_codon:yes gene_type:complete
LINLKALVNIFNMSIKIHSKAPNFKLPNQHNEMVELNEINESVVLFFYPKDNTPGCTTESIDFSKLLKKFNKLNCKVFGISKDSVKKHQNFIEKQKLLVDLLSDEPGKVCESYGVWVEKSMYGRKYMGIERTTFFINEKKLISNIWNKVKVTNHAAEVFDFAKNILS